MLSNLLNLWNLGNLFLLAVLILLAFYLYRLLTDGKKINKVEEPLRCINVFPDYQKAFPLECQSGQELQFIVKGYSDFKSMAEVLIEEDKIIWDCTKGNGTFKGSRDLKSGNYTGSTIKFITPVVSKDMLIYISVHYENLTDATWILVKK